MAFDISALLDTALSAGRGHLTGKAEKDEREQERERQALVDSLTKARTRNVNVATRRGQRDIMAQEREQREGEGRTSQALEYALGQLEPEQQQQIRAAIAQGMHPEDALAEVNRTRDVATRRSDLEFREGLGEGERQDYRESQDLDDLTRRVLESQGADLDTATPQQVADARAQAQMILAGGGEQGQQQRQIIEEWSSEPNVQSALETAGVSANQAAADAQAIMNGEGPFPTDAPPSYRSALRSLLKRLGYQGG